MSFDLRSVLEFRQFGDYAGAAVMCALGYDYVLTLPREIDFIWHQRWTWVSTMFVFVRYLGLCWAIFVSRHYLLTWLCIGAILYLVAIWTFLVFLTIADLMMILRVYAMWNRSRIIFLVLLFLFGVQTILCVIYAIVYINPNTHLLVSNAQFPFPGSLPFCVIILDVPDNITVYFMIPRFVLSAVLLILALMRTLKDAAAMYKVTKRWQPNRYMKLFVKDGIMYFSTSLLYNTMETVLSKEGFITTSTSVVLLDYFIYFLFATIMPRFIISVREMYNRDAQGRHNEVDTGFGVLSRCTTASQFESDLVSAVVFADPISEQDQAVEMDNLGTI